MEPHNFSSEKNTLRVLDLGTMIAGPFVATLLGDFGADVIKVEQPKVGDRQRSSDASGDRFQVLSRNKHSITLNLRVPEGQELLRKLACWADVLVENFRPGTMANWGLGYEDLAKVNPRLIFVSSSGWGQTGPMRGEIGYDPVGAGFGGLTNMTGFPDRPPVLPGLSMADFGTALFNTIGTLEAVRRRDGPGGTGRGEWVDCALYEPFLAMSEDAFIRYNRNGYVKQRTGSFPIAGAQADVIHGYVYESRDGRYISMIAVTDQQFINLAKLIGDDTFLRPEYDSFDKRMINYHELDPIIRKWIADRDYDEAMPLLKAADVAVGPVNNTADIVNHPHVAARENLVRMTTSAGEEVLIQNVVPHLTERPGRIRWLAEELGESNDVVYRQILGLDDAEYSDLVQRGII